MDKFIGTSGALLGAFAVAADAVGAHLLRAELAPEAYQSYTTGVHYLLLHGLLLLCLAVHPRREPPAWLWRGSQLGMLTGAVLFGGGLILWTSEGWVWARACAPFGGGLLILAWLGFAGCMPWSRPRPV